MFDNILSEFTDFPQVEVSFYHETSTYDPNTGQMVTGYSLNSTVNAWGFQKSATNSFVRDKIFDDVDISLVLESLPSKEDLMYLDGVWYSVNYPDNVGFSGSVYTIGCKRVDAPVILEDD